MVRVRPKMMANQEMLSIDDVTDILALPLLGLVLEDEQVIVKGQALDSIDDLDTLGWNMYMTPQQAAHGLALLQNYPQNNLDLDEVNGYRDLTEITVFKDYKKIEE